MTSGLIPLKIQGVILDPNTQAPIVVLKEENGPKALPIWIGAFEASAIITTLQGLAMERPMTHDLLKNILTDLKIRLKRVIIHTLQEQTYYASLLLEKNGEELSVDARPSDALALAARAGAPIFMSAQVAEAAILFEDFITASEENKYREFLENLDPEDISKYKM